MTISGAAPVGTITVVQNGGSPYVFGTTNQNGYWQTTAIEGTANVGEYYQQWYVNGVALNPVNPDIRYFPHAPTLPSFAVSANGIGANDPPEISTAYVNYCGHPGNPPRWIWSPVAYESYSPLYDASLTVSAAEQWRIQKKISLTHSAEGGDIQVFDTTSLPVGTWAATALYSQGCNEYCYGYKDECTGACFNSEAMYWARIMVNAPTISYVADYLGSVNTLAKLAIAHEFGHTLQLDHPSTRYGRCSDVTSIMYPGGVNLVSCGVTSPTSGDLNRVDSNYPVSPAYCSIGGNYCYQDTPCS